MRFPGPTSNSQMHAFVHGSHAPDAGLGVQPRRVPVLGMVAVRGPQLQVVAATGRRDRGRRRSPELHNLGLSVAAGLLWQKCHSKVPGDWPAGAPETGRGGRGGELAL
jgi:hypothetical protein